MSVIFYRRFNLLWLSLNAVREVVTTLLAQLNIEDENIANTSLVLTEYLTNLMKHNNGEDQIVTLVMLQHTQGVKIEVIEPTIPFHPIQDSEHLTAIQDGTLREGGMGLALIQHYYPSFEYKVIDDKNHFSFIVPACST